MFYSNLHTFIHTLPHLFLYVLSQNSCKQIDFEKFEKKARQYFSFFFFEKKNAKNIQTKKFKF